MISEFFPDDQEIVYIKSSSGELQMRLLSTKTEITKEDSNREELCETENKKTKYDR